MLLIFLYLKTSCHLSFDTSKKPILLAELLINGFLHAFFPLANAVTENTGDEDGFEKVFFCYSVLVSIINDSFSGLIGRERLHRLL